MTTLGLKLKNLCWGAVVLFTALSSTVLWAQDVPAPEKNIKASETAIILVDFQGNFVNSDGAWYAKFKPDYDKGMLDNTVKMVDEARKKGVWIIL